MRSPPRENGCAPTTVSAPASSSAAPTTVGVLTSSSAAPNTVSAPASSSAASPAARNSKSRRRKPTSQWSRLRCIASSVASRNAGRSLAIEGAAAPRRGRGADAPARAMALCARYQLVGWWPRQRRLSHQSSRLSKMLATRPGARATASTTARSSSSTVASARCRLAKFPTKSVRSGASPAAACDVNLVYASFWPFLEFKNDFQE
jgi:hypothetical protein